MLKILGLVVTKAVRTMIDAIGRSFEQIYELYSRRFDERG